MASTSSLGRWTAVHHIETNSKQSDHPPKQVVVSVPTSRRCAVLISAWCFSHQLLSLPPLSEARERRFKKNIPLEDYLTSRWSLLLFGFNSSLFSKSEFPFVTISKSSNTAEGLKYYDIVEGKGPVADKGSTVQVHFDCVYRGITAVSSRESKLLAGNRIIAQPYEFKVGAPPGKERKRDMVDNPNGLFSAQAAPKPPPAMYSITQGMRVGGKRTVVVPPEAGYGQKGMNEIPGGATFELNIELLQVMQPQEN